MEPSSAVVRRRPSGPGTLCLRCSASVWAARLRLYGRKDAPHPRFEERSHIGTMSVREVAAPQVPVSAADHGA